MVFFYRLPTKCSVTFYIAKLILTLPQAQKAFPFTVVVLSNCLAQTISKPLRRPAFVRITLTKPALRAAPFPSNPETPTQKKSRQPKG